MDVERKSITRNIDNLIEAGYDIGYEESKRCLKLQKLSTLFFNELMLHQNACYYII